MIYPVFLVNVGLHLDPAALPGLVQPEGVEKVDKIRASLGRELSDTFNAEGVMKFEWDAPSETLSVRVRVFVFSVETAEWAEDQIKRLAQTTQNPNGGGPLYKTGW